MKKHLMLLYFSFFFYFCIITPLPIQVRWKFRNLIICFFRVLKVRSSKDVNAQQWHLCRILLTGWANRNTMDSTEICEFLVMNWLKKWKEFDVDIQFWGGGRLQNFSSLVLFCNLQILNNDVHGCMYKQIFLSLFSKKKKSAILLLSQHTKPSTNNSNFNYLFHRRTKQIQT